MRSLTLPPVLALLLFLSIWNNTIAGGNNYPKIDPTTVTIVRDSFGIPHIFAKTDAQVAYGLAWANAEDAFKVSQDLLYAAKGMMARKEGIDGAKVDFFTHAIGARELVNKLYDTDLSPEFKLYLDGFVQGINAYAAAHNDQIQVKSAFPVTSKDVLCAYVITMSFLSGAHDYVGRAVSGTYDKDQVSFETNKAIAAAGSNAFAFDASKTTDGKTYLCINPHVRMEGQLTWYEAQLHSDEGLNMEGAMFQGTSSLAMGSNENLGWGMTWNYFHKVDIYRLKILNSKKLFYEFDGKPEKLEKKPVWLHVGLGKHHHFVLPVRKMTYWSKYGCTIKSGKSNNYYSIRYPANMSIKTAEQLYRMNKAGNYAEFWEALRLHSLALFNIIYADKDNNIFYLEGGMMAAHDTAYNWDGVVPGNTSKSLWTNLVPIDSMPHTINPSCGFVFNTNNSPFHASDEACSQKYCSLPRKMVDQRPGDNNRAERFLELAGEKSKVSLSDIEHIKFDVTMSRKGKFAGSMQPLFNLDASKYPDLKEPIDILKSWNRTFEIHEYAPTLFGPVLQEVFDKHHCSDDCFVSGVEIPESEFVAALRHACDTLKSYFGTVKVEWGNVHRNIRGKVNLPLRGFPDMLSPSYPKRVPGTMIYKPEYGDTYIMFAVFGKNGLEKLEALQPLGNSLNPESPHYNDQMELFSRQQLRPLSLKKEDVIKKAESIYYPEKKLD